ncbi:MAG: extracellular solute-binding protein [Candidatus Hadarchaeum sp.]|uniref:extracellular solute-binding protein n=1 Tax=Candidatus Hadarchaeum sp. TaxID=2883567 RepID=UPI003170E0C4
MRICKWWLLAGCGIVILSIIGVGVASAEELLPLRALGHAVHQAAARDLEPFLVQWRTYGLADVRELLFREAALPYPAYDVGYLLNTWASPIITQYFEPLNEWLERAPLPGFPADWPSGMIEALTFDGKIYAIPMRAVNNVLHYNKNYFEQRHVELPTTIEELFEAAKKLTFIREDGVRVYGMAFYGMPTIIYEVLIALARAWGPDAGVITPDYRVVCNKPPMVTVLSKLHELYTYGALPPDVFLYEVSDSVRMFQMGQVAMVFHPADYYRRFNDPSASQVAGNTGLSLIPPAADYKGVLPGSISFMTFWSFVIPKNLPYERKELAWEFIRRLSTPEAQLHAAIYNANAPTRLSVLYSDDFKAAAPYAEIAGKALSIARVPLPAFDSIMEAVDIFGTYAHMAIKGEMAPQEAMDRAAEELRALLAAEGLLRE